MSEEPGYWRWLASKPVAFLRAFMWILRWILRGEFRIDHNFEIIFGGLGFAYSIGGLVSAVPNSPIGFILAYGTATVLTFLLLTHGIYSMEVAMK